MHDSHADRILAAWVELEAALRRALPACTTAPPTQPSELLSALRMNRALGPNEEERIMALRQARNRAAHQAEEPSREEADAYLQEVAALMAVVCGDSGKPC